MLFAKLTDTSLGHTQRTKIDHPSLHSPSEVHFKMWTEGIDIKGEMNKKETE